MFTHAILVTCLIAAYQVNIGQIKVIQFSGLVTYMAQLRTPFNFFSALYQSIQSPMIYLEQMLELLKDLLTVTDKPSAQNLSSCNGNISFNNVSFAYGTRNFSLIVLTFSCFPSITTALVGESGSNESTLFQLPFRFLNVNNGNIKIDGCDVQRIKIDSFCCHISIVPEDPTLFNESILFNLKYANQSATDKEVEAA